MKLSFGFCSSLILFAATVGTVQTLPEAFASNAKTIVKHELSVKEAESIALKEFPGDVVESEKERFHKEDVYSVEIKSADKRCEIAVRISDGKIVSKKMKTHDSDDEENDDDGDE